MVFLRRETDPKLLICWQEYERSQRSRTHPQQVHATQLTTHFRTHGAWFLLAEKRKLLKVLVGAQGLEPRTSCV